MTQRSEAVKDDLDVWMDRIAGRLGADGLAVELGYDDRMMGDALALMVTVDGDACEIDALRSRRRHAHVAVFAESEAAAARLANALERAHQAVSRLANSERKFVHRLERVAEHLVDGWAGRRGGFPEQALALLKTAVPEARPMLGVGYHIDVGAQADSEPRKKDKHRYDPLYAASVPVGARRRALPWNPARKAFAVPASARSAMPQAPPGSPLAMLLLGGVGVAGAAALLEHADQQARRGKSDSSSTTGDTIEATSEVCCELPDFLSSVSSCIPDSSWIPDCGSFDVPDCDCGGFDL